MSESNGYHEGSNTYSLASWMTTVLPAYDRMTRPQFAKVINEVINGAHTVEEYVTIYGEESRSEFIDVTDFNFDDVWRVWNAHYEDEVSRWDADDLVLWGYGVARIRDLWVK